MHRMGAPPEIVRRQCQYADATTNPVVSTAVPKKRTMAAIMLDHEQANEKTGGGREGQQETKAIADVEREPH